MAVKRKLTVKQLKLVKGISQGKSMTQAAVDAGYGNNPDSARAIAYETLQKPSVASALEAALDKMGATIEQSAAVIANAHTAKETKFFQCEGRVVDTREVDDHPTRLKAAELNLRARKLMAGSDEKSNGAPTVNFIAALTIVKQVSEQRGLPL